jgi:DNA-directed RNA polymerase specialized sigma24 family protein
LTSLSADDIRRLVSYARFLRGPNDANDLIQEAYCRVLGPRRWRADMASVPFLYGVMRSISDRRNQKGLTAVSLDNAEEAAQGVDDHPLADQITPERNAIAAEAIKELEAHFAHDEHVGYFLMGSAEGKTALETQAATGMSPQEYDAARKRVLRYRGRQKKGE